MKWIPYKPGKIASGSIAADRAVGTSVDGALRIDTDREQIQPESLTNSISAFVLIHLAGSVGG
jgi:hypothetical protein